MGRGGPWERRVVQPAAARAVFKGLPRAIGRQVYELRTLLGLSQQELADRAAVSQGAISRLERGRCDQTPLRTLLPVFVELIGQLGPVTEECSPEVQRVITVVEAMWPLATNAPRVLTDPGLGRLIETYRHLGDQERQVFLRIVGAVAELVRDNRR